MFRQTKRIKAKTSIRMSPTVNLSSPRLNAEGQAEVHTHSQHSFRSETEPTANDSEMPKVCMPEALIPDGGGEGQFDNDAPIAVADPAAIASIREFQVQRVATVKMQNRINNQCRALVRRGLGWRMDLPEKEQKAINALAKSIVDAIQKGETVPPEHQCIVDGLGAFCIASRESRRFFDAHRASVEKSMIALAETLPAHDWVKATPGLGSLGLAIIIGEAGDLSNYANPAKLWKRLGLAVFNGKSQRKCTDAEEAIRQGYNPRRRSAIWTIADSMLKTAGPYREIYVARRAYELANHPEFDKGIDKKTGKQKVTMHCHRRSTRYAEKRMVRDLWRTWRGQTSLSMLPNGEMSVLA